MATVSRVLNKDPTLSVSGVTRTKIVTVAEELDYRPLKERRRQPAKANSSHHQNVAEIFLELGERWKLVSEGSYYARLKNGVENRCMDLDIHVTTAKRLYPELFRSDGKIRGAIVVGPGSGVHSQEADLWKDLLVFADCFPEIAGFDSVAHDLSAATEQLLCALTSRGFRRIGFVGGFALECRDGIQETRFATYRDWLRHRGQFDDSLVAIAGRTMDIGQDCARNVLNAGPDAIIACTDDMAIGVYKAIRDAGLSVPGDIAVVGFNDNPASELLDPALSSIRLAPEEIGSTAVDLLLERLAGRTVAKRVVLDCPMIWRKSTG